MVIGISGSSGSGKSTVTKILDDKLNNSISIIVDDIMKKNIKEIYRDEIVKAFGLEELNPVSLFDSFESVKKWMNICEGNMSNELELLIKDYKEKYDYVLVDYSLLPMMRVYEMCDVTVSVVADINVKIGRLKERLIRTGHIAKWYNDETLINRMKCSTLEDFGYKSQYTITNNTTLEVLEKQVDDLIVKINEN